MDGSDDVSRRGKGVNSFHIEQAKMASRECDQHMGPCMLCDDSDWSENGQRCRFNVTTTIRCYNSWFVVTPGPTRCYNAIVTPGPTRCYNGVTTVLQRVHTTRGHKKKKNIYTSV